MGSSRDVVTRWEEIPDEFVREGVRRRAFGTDNVMLVLNECSPGMDTNPHVHDFDQIALILQGHATYYIEDEGHEMGPGSVMLIPAGKYHHIVPKGEETVLNLDVFGPARDDLRHLYRWMSAGGGGEEGGEG